MSSELTRPRFVSQISRKTEPNTGIYPTAITCFHPLLTPNLPFHAVEPGVASIWTGLETGILPVVYHKKISFQGVMDVFIKIILR